MIFKKSFLCFLALCLSAALCACGQNSGDAPAASGAFGSAATDAADQENDPADAANDQNANDPNADGTGTGSQGSNATEAGSAGTGTTDTGSQEIGSTDAGGQGTDDPDTEAQESQPSQPQKEDPSMENAEASPLVPSLELEQQTVPDNEALAFVRNLKIGWNLGNTFDATRDGGYSENEMSLETAWVGAKTTKEMIQMVKDAGFETLRIPVSWHNHFTDDNFTISEQWLDRVQEVVDWALDLDMYVILNTHHDVEPEGYYPTPDRLEASKTYISRVWSQLSERFADYDEHLIFESMNEPRMKGTNYEWWLDKNNQSCKDSVDCINQLNQVFVDTVRAGGSSNAGRYLMVPAYCAAPENAADDAFVLPSDTAENKLIVSVHAYKPYAFALQGPNESGSTDAFDPNSASSTREINNFLDMVYKKFVQNGVPVVIGEFGAREKNGNLKARVDMSAYYIAYASARGIPCVWWDNNAFVGSGENFGLLDRNVMVWRYPDILDALMAYCMKP